ncbi:glycosyl transferase [Spirochaeta thermophila]|nr:glycosyl transferase [Spirochaeta thermophila]
MSKMRILTKLYHRIRRGTKKKIQYLFYLLRLKKEIFVRKDVHLALDSSSDEVIISLTTFPARFNVLGLCLKSLLYQRVRPHRLIVWLAEEEVEGLDLSKQIPEFEFFVRSGIEFALINENLRSYNKLLPALKRYPRGIIVTCDDDILYPPWFLEKMVRAYNPEEICFYRAWEMETDPRGRMTPYHTWNDASSKTPSSRLFFTGVGGVLYPPGSLAEEVFNVSRIRELCPSGDDIWFNAMALLKGTKKRLLLSNSYSFPIIKESLSQRSALRERNVAQGFNDVMLRAVFDCYNLYQFL